MIIIIIIINTMVVNTVTAITFIPANAIIAAKPGYYK